MRLSEITRALRTTAAFSVPWPTNLAWRIQFKRFRDDDPLLSIRDGKVFAMPFRNWKGTYTSLTGKDFKKIEAMPKEVVEVSDDALVGDMALINIAQVARQRGEDAREALQQYEAGLIPYRRFVQDPDVFRKPEVMMARPAQTAGFALVYNREARSVDEMLLLRPL